MATKDQAISNARFFMRTYGGREFIYRVGAAWMHTNKTLEAMQGMYRKELKDYQEVSKDE